MSGLQNARDPARADFDWRGFAGALRRRQSEDGRALRPIAEAAGVTVTDLSRAMGGQIVSAAKVFALCDWLGTDPRRFYLPPIRFGESDAESTRFSGSNVKHIKGEGVRRP